MITQNNLLLLLLSSLLLCSLTGLSAQNLELHSTPTGIYVEVSGGPATTEGWTIQRVRTREANEQRFALRPGLDRNSYRQRLANFNRWFPDGATLPPSMADSLWDLRNSGRTITHPAYLLASGRAITDTTATAPGTYEYQLRDPQGQVVARQTIRHPREARLPHLQAAANPQAELAELRWHTRNPQDIWSAVVFRQDPVTSAFERIHPLVLTYRHPDHADSVSVIVRDTALNKPGYWRYYIEPVDRFGNRSRTAEVGHVLVLDPESRPGFTELRTESLVDRPAIRLSWTGDRNARLQAIRVYRSRTYGGEYELRATLPATANEYVDEVPIAREPFFYYLETEEVGGRALRSAIVTDYFNGPVAPLTPHSITAETAERGIEIHWQGDSRRNYGYVVYRGRDASGEMIPISPFLHARDGRWSYLDTSRQLQAGQVYSYAVRSVSPTDERSELSERAFVTCAGAIFVPAPRSLEARLRAGQVILSWEDLTAREARIVGYHVYRKSSPDGEFVRLTDSMLDLYDNRFIDTPPPASGSHTYAVRAVDLSCQESAFSTEKVIQTSRQIDLRPEVVEGAQTTTGNVLAWSPLPYPEQVQSITIYRAAEGGHFVQLDQLDASQTRYDDTQIDPALSYRYQLVVTDQAGNASAPTRVLTMKR